MLDYNLILDKIIANIYSDNLKKEGYNLFEYLNNDEINNQFALQEELKVLINNYEFSPFIKSYDITNILERLKKGYDLTPKDASDIFNEVIVAKDLRKKLNLFHSDKVEISNLEKIIKEIFPHSYISDIINKTLDTFSNFKQTASKTYEKIIDEKITIENTIDEILNNLKVKYSKILVDGNIYLKDNKKTLLVNTGNKNKINGDVISYSATNKGTFIEPNEIKKHNIKLIYLTNKQKEEEKNLLKKIKDAVLKDYKTLLKNQELYKILDLIYAKTTFAIKYNCNPVKLNHIPIYKINNFRHPLINGQITPISINFNKDTYLITGPNTGGKTASLKSLGLSILLAKSGIEVPCDANSIIYPKCNIYADIGDMQSLTSSLSTFSSHIKNIIDIINLAKKDDLVILDELGAGTDPIEGSALAISLIEYFKNNNIKLMLTSHYPDIKKYSIGKSWIKCASVSFNEKTLMPEYHLREDILGKSNALLIANNLGLNKKILNNAKNIIKNLKSKEQIKLENLDEKQEELLKKEEVLNNKILAFKNEIKTKNNEYQQKIKDLNKEYLNNKMELENEINKLKDDLRNTIKKIEKDNQDHKIASAKEKLRKEINTKTINEDIKVGDNVYIIPYKTNGSVEEINNNTYVVLIGNLTFNFAKDELLLSKEENKKEIVKPKKRHQTRTLTYVRDIDLRGCRLYEISDILDNAFSKMLLSNQEELKIITGKGTGTIRDGVIKYLKKNKQIKDYRFGNHYEGGVGCIVVSFKK